MKRLLLVLSLSASGLIWAQNRQLPVAPNGHLKLRSASGSSQAKTITCQDTLRYPQAKEQILGTPTFNIFNIYQSDAEAISQTYLNSSPITISGIEFFGYRNTGSSPTVVVNAAIYNVDASYTPTTVIASGNITITSTTAGYRYVSFAPVVVTGNYAVVLTATNAGGILDFYVNDATAGQSYDETLTRYKSNYYTNSGGAYVTIPTLTTDPPNFPTTYNFEPLVAPIVSYTINTSFTNTPSSVCLGSPVTMTNTTPMGTIQNRFTSYQAFSIFFGMQSNDSTFFYWYGDNTTEGWGPNSSHTYASAGSYTDTLVTVSGFWNSCVDYTTRSVVVNPLDDASFAYSTSTICAGSANPIPTTTMAGGTFSSTTGLVFADATTGEIDMSASSNGTYTISYTTAGPCPQTSTQNLTITSSPDASFTYSAGSYCQNVTDPSPSFTTGSAGTFSSTTGIMLASNGTIDVSASMPGMYTITNTIPASGACPTVTSTQSVTILMTPVISVSGNTTICNGNSTTLTASGAMGYSWSPATNLSSTNTASTDASPTTTTTYTVTGMEMNGCSSSQNVTITVNDPVTPSFPATASYCVGESAMLNTTSSNGVSGTWMPSTVSTAMAGTTTYTFTPASGTCATTATTVITVNDNPTVTFATVNDLCVYNPAVTLSGTPAGGTFSGTGVTGTSFDPATAGTGTFTLTYMYTDANGCDGTQTQDVMVDACLGLEESAQQILSVYPNPVSDALFVKYTAAQSNLSIVSTDGKTLYSQSFTGNVETTIDLTSFAPAMYNVVMTSDAGTTTVKVVKK